VTKFRTILLGEDDANDAEMTVRALRSNGLLNDVVVARDGVEVMDYLRRRGAWTERSGGLPGLLLLDIKMPRRDGLDVLREIRDDPVLKVLPVVVLTSSREHPDLQRAYELGANAYVVKPIGFEKFADAVQRIGAFWAMVNEPPLDEDGESEPGGGITVFETK
jgi:two-component system, response regulator